MTALAEPRFEHLTGLGWGSLGVLELTALPSIGATRTARRGSRSRSRPRWNG